MAEDVKIFDGTNWKSLVGPEGPTVVSADLVNVARLGTDGKLLVAQADLDSRYVNITGDTMTGGLTVSPTSLPAYPVGSIQLSPAVQGTACIGVESFTDVGLAGAAISTRRSRGTPAARQPVIGGDFIGELSMWAFMPNGAYGRASINQVYVSESPTASDIEPVSRLQIHGTGGITVQSGPQPTPRSVCDIGLNWTTPTRTLEVGGDTMLRGPLEVTGDIASTGTSHSFAAGSIPSSAVIGSTAFTPATSAAAGTAGSMRWDENFLYIRTATAWKRVALTAF